MDEMTVEFIESRLHRRRWCAFHGVFHDLDAFSPAQRLVAHDAPRYCHEFSNSGKRAASAAKEPVVGVEELRSIAKTLKITVTDMPAAAESYRGTRMANRAAGGGGGESSRSNGDPPPVVAGAVRARSPPGARATKPPAAKAARSQTTQPAANGPAQLSEAELEDYLLRALPNLTAYDNNHTDETTERDDKNELMNYEDYPGDSDLQWTLALDNVRSRSNPQLNALAFDDSAV